MKIKSKKIYNKRNMCGKTTTPSHIICRTCVKTLNSSLSCAHDHSIIFMCLLGSAFVLLFFCGFCERVEREIPVGHHSLSSYTHNIFRNNRHTYISQKKKKLLLYYIKQIRLSPGTAGWPANSHSNNIRWL